MYHLICCFVFSNQLKLDHITAIFPTSLEGSIKQALFSESLSGAVFLLLKKKHWGKCMEKYQHFEYYKGYM